LSEGEIKISPDKSNHRYTDAVQSLSKIKVYANYPSKEALSDAHTIGKVVLDNKFSPGELVKVLCDTGALSANYIAASLIKRLKSKINNERFFNTKCKVTLADNRTVKSIDKGVKLKLVLKDSNANRFVYTGDFFILDMEKNDIIVGLPALTGKLYPFLQSMMADANVKYIDSETKEDKDSELNHIDEDHDLHQMETQYPWTKKKEDIAPEEDLCDLPVNFGPVLEFLGKSREEAIKEYDELCKLRVSDELKSNTDIMEYLRTRAVEAFVPRKWEGIKDIKPLKVEWLDTLPARMKPKARPINPRLWECTEKEFRRLCGYFYKASRSPWASCLVVAPKATPPYIRFCGDYVLINKHMKVGNYTIPNVKHELSRIIKFPIYLDIDLTNAFHQIPLHPETREKLSIQTPWGQYEPDFMPEGIAPATGILQETVRELFSEFDEWAIVIFDNLLLLATDPVDAFEKFKLLVEKCIERRVILKMAKSWLGFRKVEFFGYTCQHKSYQVCVDKKEALNNIPFPNKTKEARSLLGKGVFFSGFTPNYSKSIGHLTDMTKKTFNWNERYWKHDYRGEFKTFIKSLQDACELFYPDYELEWVLRTDASELGVGAVLLQKKILPDGTIQWQPIAFVSKKFSGAAENWSTIEQEAFGIFYAVKALSYYLIGKEFVVETDHNNLLWMESSEVPKVIRWRIYLQAFNILIKHIPGKQNIIADWFSRTFPEPAQELASIAEYLNKDSRVDSETYRSVNAYYHWLHGLYSEDIETNAQEEQEEKELGEQVEDKVAFTKQQALETVHNGKVGHMGAKVTWTRLNAQFPGHGISFQQIQEHVAACPNCNKTRLGMRDTLKPIIRTLKPPSARTAIGIDALEITPHSEEGYTHINVVVNLFTKLVYLHPVKGVTAMNLAESCWKYWTTYGHTDMIISDQGPDLKSHLFEELTKYMGMRHVFSIADKHANGVERTLGEVVRHLRSRVYDESSNVTNQDIFKDSTWLASVQYILNSEINSETGFSPFELTFGSDANKYMTMASGELADKPHARLSKLNADLNRLHTESSVIQQKLIKTRKESGVLPSEHNTFQAGDFVLYDKGSKVTPKMSHRYRGPHLVKGQRANDVTVQHMATGETKTYDVQDLKLYAGTQTDAIDMARRDQDQHVIDRIISHTGDRSKRTSLHFKVLFSDGETTILPFSKDLYDSIPYETYVDSIPYLRHLKFTTDLAKDFIREMGSKNITGYEINQEVFLNIRIFGDLWFDKLELPDSDTITYVSSCTITECTRKKLVIRNTITKESHTLLAYAIYCFLHSNFDNTSMLIIDEEFMIKYPQIKIH